MIEIYGLIFSCIIGTIGHFLFDLSNNNKIIGLFFAQNESTWEHMKLGITPIIIWSIIEFIILKNPNIIINTSLKIIVFSLSIIILYYGYKKILIKNIFILDILVFYISLATAFLIGINVINNTYIWYLYIPALIFLSSTIYAYKNFSKNPPNSFIFKD